MWDLPLQLSARLSVGSDGWTGLEGPVNSILSLDNRPREEGGTKR